MVSWHDDKLVVRPLRVSPSSEFRTLLSLAEAGLMEKPELEVEEGAEELLKDFLTVMLLGETPESFFDEEVLVPVREELAKLVVEHVPHEGEVKISGGKVIVKNSYGTWKLELSDGSLYLQGRSICFSTDRALVPGMTLLPGLGNLKLGELSTKVVAGLVVALRPELVKDEELKEQIEEARLLGGDYLGDLEDLLPEDLIPDLVRIRRLARRLFRL